jgi:hypothetical protein
MVPVCHGGLFDDAAGMGYASATESCSLGVRMYCRNAEERHQPSICMVPRAAAVVAAPILKLCPA